MKSFVALLIAVCVYAQSPSSPTSTTRTPTLEQMKRAIASFPPDEQVYELWRFWLVGQPLEVQKLFDKDATKSNGLDLYRSELRTEGDSAAEIERKIRIIDKDGEHWEIERWNRVLTSNSPRINWKPNAFLVEMVKNRKPGRALDTGMGQGRNALWLAGQGWETTGYDPAEGAVALARDTAAKAGLKLNTVVATDKQFDMGIGRWDLILVSYVEIRENAAKVTRALAPGGVVIAEYFHQDSSSAPGGFADNELLHLFDGFANPALRRHRGSRRFWHATDAPRSRVRRKAALNTCSSILSDLRFRPIYFHK